MGRHGPMGVGLTRHAVPCGPCLSGTWAWPSAQARHYGPIFVSCWPVKYGNICRPCQPTARFTCNTLKNSSHSQSFKFQSTFTE